MLYSGKFSKGIIFLDILLSILNFSIVRVCMSTEIKPAKIVYWYTYLKKMSPSKISHYTWYHNTLISILPPSGVFDEIVAAGPVPALVMALTLKLYEVKGLKPGILMSVVSLSRMKMSGEEPGPTTSTAYLVMVPFHFSTGTGDQDSSAVVGNLCLILSPPGLPEGAGSKCVHMHVRPQQFTCRHALN